MDLIAQKFVFAKVYDSLGQKHVSANFQVYISIDMAINVSSNIDENIS